MPILPPPGVGASAEALGRRQRLLDVYGPLLTEHQREACRLHLDEDWSFTELAESFGTTRSGAHDLVRRALEQLERYEERLGHAAALSDRAQRETALVERIAGLEILLADRG